LAWLRTCWPSIHSRTAPMSNTVGFGGGADVALSVKAIRPRMVEGLVQLMLTDEMPLGQPADSAPI